MDAAGLDSVDVLCLVLLLHPVASFGGLWILLGLIAFVAYLFGQFLGRPAMGLTAGGEAVVCAAIVLALRSTGYRLTVVGREEGVRV